MPNNEALYILSSLVDRYGWDPTSAIGGGANIGQETAGTFSPGINEYGKAPGTGGFGLAQWTGPRRKELAAYAERLGKPVDDMELQVDFLNYDLAKNYPDLYSKLTTPGGFKTHQEATKAISDIYENPGKPAMSSRYGYGKKLESAWSELQGLMGPKEAEAAAPPTAISEGEGEWVVTPPQQQAGSEKADEGGWQVVGPDEMAKKDWWDKTKDLPGQIWDAVSDEVKQWPSVLWNSPKTVKEALKSGTAGLLAGITAATGELEENPMAVAHTSLADAKQPVLPMEDMGYLARQYMPERTKLLDQLGYKDPKSAAAVTFRNVYSRVGKELGGIEPPGDSLLEQAIYGVTSAVPSLILLGAIQPAAGAVAAGLSAGIGSYLISNGLTRVGTAIGSKAMQRILGSGFSFLGLESLSADPLKGAAHGFGTGSLLGTIPGSWGRVSRAMAGGAFGGAFSAAEQMLEGQPIKVKDMFAASAVMAFYSALHKTQPKEGMTRAERKKFKEEQQEMKQMQDELAAEKAKIDEYNDEFKVELKQWYEGQKAEDAAKFKQQQELSKEVPPSKEPVYGRTVWEKEKSDYVPLQERPVEYGKKDYLDFSVPATEKAVKSAEESAKTLQKELWDVQSPVGKEGLAQRLRAEQEAAAAKEAERLQFYKDEAAKERAEAEAEYEADKAAKEVWPDQRAPLKEPLPPSQKSASESADVFKREMDATQSPEGKKFLEDLFSLEEELFPRTERLDAGDDVSKSAREAANLLGAEEMLRESPQGKDWLMQQLRDMEERIGHAAPGEKGPDLSGESFSQIRDRIARLGRLIADDKPLGEPERAELSAIQKELQGRDPYALMADMVAGRFNLFETSGTVTDPFGRLRGEGPAPESRIGTITDVIKDFLKGESGEAKLGWEKDLIKKFGNLPIFKSNLFPFLGDKLKTPTIKNIDQLISDLKRWEGKDINKEELRWSGLVPWLEQQRDAIKSKERTEPVTKKEIGEFLIENQIQFEEVWHGKPTEAETAVLQEQFKRYNDEANAVYDEVFAEINKVASEQDITVRSVNLNDNKFQGRVDGVAFVFDLNRFLGDDFVRNAQLRYNEAVNNADNIRIQLEEGSNLKYSQYTEPGGTNQREFILTLPNAAGEYESGHWPGVKNPVLHARTNDRKGPNGERVLFIEELQSDWHQKGRAWGYKDLRVQQELERIGKEWRDIEDQKLLLLDNDPELKKYSEQLREVIDASDAREGYLRLEKKMHTRDVQRDPELKKLRHQELLLTRKQDQRTAELIDPLNEKIDALYEEETKIYDLYPDPDKLVPPAPFADSWHELGMKRMLRFAAENGYDKVAWTPSDIQIKRWGSEAFIWDKTKVETKEGVKDAWKLKSMEQMGGEAGGVNIEQAARQRGELIEGEQVVTSKEQLHEIVKDTLKREADINSPKRIRKVTDNLWDRMQKADSGEYLPRVEGFREFYDSKSGIGGIKRFVEKYGKQWGAKVEKEAVINQKGYLEVDYITEMPGTADKLYDIYKSAADKSAQGDTRYYYVTPHVMEARRAIISGDLTYKKAIKTMLEDISHVYPEIARSIADEVGGITYNIISPSDSFTVPITPDMKKSVTHFGQPLFGTSLKPEAIKLLKSFLADERGSVSLGWEYQTFKKFIDHLRSKFGERGNRIADDLAKGVLPSPEVVNMFKAFRNDLANAEAEAIPDLVVPRNVTLSKRDEQDVFNLSSTMKGKVMDAISGISQSLRSAMQNGEMSPLEAAQRLYKSYYGFRTNEYNKAAAELDKIGRDLKRLDSKETIKLLKEDASNYQSGKGVSKRMQKVMEVYDRLREPYEEAFREIMPDWEGKLHYLRQMFKRPKGGWEKWTALNKTSFDGPAAFFKAKKYPTWADGLAAGLEPRKGNIVDIMKTDLMEKQQFVDGYRLAQKWLDMGVIQKQPGWQKGGLPAGKDEIRGAFGRMTYVNTDGTTGGRFIADKDVANFINGQLHGGLFAAIDNSIARPIPRAIARAAGKGWIGSTNALRMIEVFGPWHFYTIDGAAREMIAGNLPFDVMGDLFGKGRELHGSRLAHITSFIPGSSLYWNNKIAKVIRDTWLTGKGPEWAKDAAFNYMEGGGRFQHDVRKWINWMSKDAKEHGTVVGDAMYEIMQDVKDGRLINATQQFARTALEPLMKYFVTNTKLTAHGLLSIEPMRALRDKYKVTGYGKDAKTADPADQHTYEVERLRHNQSVQRFVDYTMGQIPRENVLYHNVVKDILSAAIHFPTWNLGTLGVMEKSGIGLLKHTSAGIGRAVGSQAMKDWGKVTPLERQSLRYISGLAIIHGLQGAVLHRMFTGDWPTTLKDIYYPVIQKEDVEKGLDEERGIWAGYAKTMLMFGTQPYNTVVGLQNHVIAKFGELLRNRTWDNTYIRTPGAGIGQQAGEVGMWAAKSVRPFMLSQYQEGKTPLTQFGGLVGIQRVPRALTRTPDEEVMHDYSSGKAGARTQAEKETAELRSDVRSLVRQGKEEEAIDKLIEGQNKGIITERQALNTLKDNKIGELPRVRQFSSLSIDKMIKVFEAASPERRQQYLPYLLKKVDKMNEEELEKFGDKLLGFPEIEELLRQQ